MYQMILGTHLSKLVWTKNSFANIC